MEQKSISRRRLIKETAIAAIGSTLLFNSKLMANGQAPKSPNTKVILVRDKNVLTADGKANREILSRMLNDAIIALTSEKTATAAWKKIIQPSDVLGIKTNVWSNLATPPELEEILKERAIEIGIDSGNISINDRGVLKDEVFKRATALINVRPMRTHSWAGVGSLIKNYIMFAERPADYHDDSCADLAKVWNLEQIKGKTRLNILVMLTPLFHGVGPHHFNKKYTWQYGGLLVGIDPVAVDSVGLRIIEAKRTAFFEETTPLNPPAKHIPLADTRHHLGTADVNKIDLVRIGWEEESLI